MKQIKIVIPGQAPDFAFYIGNSWDALTFAMDMLGSYNGSYSISITNYSSSKR